jgi:hypothetical protein
MGERSSFRRRIKIALGERSERREEHQDGLAVFFFSRAPNK